MDNSVERDKRVEGQFPDLVASFKLLVTNVEKLKNSHQSLRQEVARLQVERDKAIEGLRKIRAYYKEEGYYGYSVANRFLSDLGVPHETT